MGSALRVQLICPFVCLLLNLAWTLTIICLGLPVLSYTRAYTRAPSCTVIGSLVPTSGSAVSGPGRQPPALAVGSGRGRLLHHACGCRCRHLEHNSLVEVNSGSLYGLTALHQLHLGNNSISRINRDGWSFCQKLHEL